MYAAMQRPANINDGTALCLFCKAAIIFNNRDSFCSKICFERTTDEIPLAIQVKDKSNEPQLYHTYSRGREEVGFSDILRQEIERRNLLENMLEARNKRITELERSTKEMQRSQADRVTKLYDIVNNLVGKQERDGGTSEQNAARQEIERRNLLENMLEARNKRITELERSTKEMQRSQADKVTKLYDIVNNLVGKQERDGGTSEQNAARQTRLEEEFKSLKEVIAGLQLSIETKDREKDALVENKQALDEERLNIRQENKKLTETLEKLTKENKTLQGKVMSLESTIFELKDEVRGQQSQVKDMKINGEELKSGMVKNAEVLRAISSNMPVLKELSQLGDKLQEMLKKADNFFGDKNGGAGMPNLNQTFNISNTITQPVQSVPQPANTTGGNGNPRGNPLANVSSPTPESTMQHSDNINSKSDTGFNEDQSLHTSVLK